MNQFENLEDGQHVRLRSRELGTYLHADKDGLGVSLRQRRASMKVAWTVHIYNGARGRQYLLLHSAAYGRYLASMRIHGFRAEQCDYELWEAEAIRWQAVRLRSGDGILLRHASGNCLRANRRPGHRNDGVSVDDISSASPMRHWVVERIPARQVAPRLPAPKWFRLPEIFSFLEPRRVIRYEEAGADDLNSRPTFVFYGRSVFRLRKELASLVDPAMDAANLVMCVRAGLRGRRTPLVVNLPRNEETLHIVVFHARTPANAQLRYPDVNAE